MRQRTYVSQSAALRDHLDTWLIVVFFGRRVEAGGAVVSCGAAGAGRFAAVLVFATGAAVAVSTFGVSTATDGFAMIEAAAVAVAGTEDKGDPRIRAEKGPESTF